MPSQEYQVILDLLAARPDESQLSFVEKRASFEQRVKVLPVAGGISCEPVSAGGVPAEWIVPPEAPKSSVLLYLHGGGYCEGSINTHRSMLSHIATTTPIKALAIDYRLAPEHPFPAALEDSLAAYQWLLSEGFTFQNIIMAGDSAGGGLTVATLVALKEKDIPLPAAAVLLSPWVDLTASGDSISSKAEIDPMITQTGLTEMAQAYAGDMDPATPLISPLFADLKGLPPLLIHVGTAEILFDDAARLADRAGKAGVKVTLKKGEDMCHVWHFFVPILPEAVKAVDEVAQFIRAHLRE